MYQLSMSVLFSHNRLLILSVHKMWIGIIIFNESDTHGLQSDTISVCHSSAAQPIQVLEF